MNALPGPVPMEVAWSMGSRRLGASLLAVIALVLLAASQLPQPAASHAAAEAGYVDFAFGPARTVTPSSQFEDQGPTATKPQSKLWFNDGLWWGALLNGNTHTYDLYRFGSQTQQWTDTGTIIDTRSTAHPDCLWDTASNHLYVASAVPPGDPGNTAIHILRYTYDATMQTYTRDSDSIPASAGVEAVVLDKDTTGAVWLTYTLDTGTNTRAVYVTHSLAAGGFISPYIIPVPGANNLTADDIAGVVAFGGHIGVMWSNQAADAMYFATHTDGGPEGAWQRSTAYSGQGYADDHLNLKSLDADPSGQVFAVMKTSRNDLVTPDPTDPLIVLLVLPNTGAWVPHTVSRVQDNQTRPITLIDTTNREIYIFAASNAGQVPSGIYYKLSSLDNVAFADGQGLPFIVSTAHPNVNNATSTKQNLSAGTDVLVAASDLASGYYLHNVLTLPAVSVTPSPVATTTPSGTATATTTPGSTVTATPSDTPSATATTAPTSTATATPSGTATVTATATTIPSSTATATGSRSPTVTSTWPPTGTPTAAPTRTRTPVPSVTATAAPGETWTPTGTPALTGTPTASPSSPATWTPTHSTTGSPTTTPPSTPPPGDTPTATVTASSTATATVSATRTPVLPATPSPAHSPPASSTPGAARPTPTACTIAFSDVLRTDYFYGPVQYLACHGVISGYADSTFRPFTNTTRSQMLKIVILAFGLPTRTPPAGGYTFADVPPTHPFFAVVETAAGSGVVSGYTCGGPGEPCDGMDRPYFRPYGNVTRGQLSKIVVVAAGWATVTPATATFTDVAPGSAFYPFVETAACRRLVSGYTCGEPGEPCDSANRAYFRPGHSATRGQIAKIVYNAVFSSGVCSGASEAPR